MAAIEEWKQMWTVLTLGTDQDQQEAFRAGGEFVEDVLESFGSELTSLGRRVWDIQANALAKAPFMREA